MEEKMTVVGWCEGCCGPVISDGALQDENGCWTCVVCVERLGLSDTSQ